MYPGMGNLAGEYDVQGNLISRYGYGLGLVSKDDHFYTFDGNGNTSEITSPADAVVNAYAYDPFGTPLAETEGITNAFKFSGQLGVRQTEDDLLFMRNRFYSPSLGRFMTEDPIGLAGGDVGFYRYVQNNPVNFVDPWGLWSFWFGGTAVVATPSNGSNIGAGFGWDSNNGGAGLYATGGTSNGFGGSIGVEFGVFTGSIRGETTTLTVGVGNIAIGLVTGDKWWHFGASIAYSEGIPLETSISHNNTVFTPSDSWFSNAPQCP